jgi:hypothetical protein
MYYVYELIDPRNERPFYVGKGSGDRLKEHAKAARNGGTGRKCDVIREIWAAGLEICERIVREFDDELRAYAFEKRHIKSIGRENLTNLMPGGGGVRPTHKIETRLDSFTAKASLLRLWATKRPRKGSFWSEAIWRALERAIPGIFQELVGEFGRDATEQRLLAEYGLKLIENRA